MSERIEGPCQVCGDTNYSLSMGGPTICPACDAGVSLRQRLVAFRGALHIDNDVIAALRAEVERLQAALLAESEAWSAVKEQENERHRLRAENATLVGQLAEARLVMGQCRRVMALPEVNAPFELAAVHGFVLTESTQENIRVMWDRFDAFLATDSGAKAAAVIAAAMDYFDETDELRREDAFNVLHNAVDTLRREREGTT